MHNTTFDSIVDNLKLALDIVENCGEAYRNANDSTKKLMNQAIFNKFYIVNDVDHEFDVEFSFKPPFDKMLEPIKEDISKINSAIRNHSSKLEKFIDIAKGHIQDFLECGLSDVDNPSNMTTHSNNGYFFRHNSSSKELLVEMRGIEPLSEILSSGLSSTTVIEILFPRHGSPMTDFHAR